MYCFQHEREFSKLISFLAGNHSLFEKEVRLKRYIWRSKVNWFKSLQRINWLDIMWIEYIRNVIRVTNTWLLNVFKIITTFQTASYYLNILFHILNHQSYIIDNYFVYIKTFTPYFFQFFIIIRNHHSTFITFDTDKRLSEFISWNLVKDLNALIFIIKLYRDAINKHSKYNINTYITSQH